MPPPYGPAGADNNNIGKCTADQVKYSDSLKYVAGTFVR